MYFDDLTYVDAHFVAVGWLERGREWTRGDVDERFFAKLVELLVNPWQAAANAGFHQCDLCRFSDGTPSLCYKGTTIEMGRNNLYVPGEDCIYYSPSTIAHYIDAHEYSPPQPFMEAVLCCPPMRSMNYLKKLLDHGARALVQPQSPTSTL